MEKRHFLILLISFVGMVGFSQSRTYNYYGLIAKPVTYYKFWNNEAHPISLFDVGWSEAMKRWEPLLNEMDNIIVKCYLDYAVVTIKEKSGKTSDFSVKRENSNFYESSWGKDSESGMILKIISEKYCTVYIRFGNDCISIENRSIIE